MVLDRTAGPPAAVRRSGVALLVCAVLSGCASRASLHRVVLDYDESVSRAHAEMLLLNIARARYRRPLHFTAVSGIAATFDYRVDASLGGELAESGGVSIFVPSLGRSVSENPTISIVPIQGEEFTRRLLKPLDESVLGFFYHQGVDAALLLRLMAHAVIVERDGRREVLLNGGERHPSGFEALLREVDAEDGRQQLDVGPLLFEQEWPVPDGGAPTATELAELLERGYEFSDEGGGGALIRRVAGRQVIANYDLTTLSNEEVVELQREAQEYPSYFVLMDLRARGGQAGSIRGWVKLRSLGAIIDAAAAAVGAPRAHEPSPPLRIVESAEAPAECLFSVPYEGMHYSVPLDDEAGSASAFGVLYRLYQMTVAEVPGVAVPPVTIAK